MTDSQLTVWCAWLDNGMYEAPSLIGIYATKELAEAEADQERRSYGSPFVDEWQVEGLVGGPRDSTERGPAS